MEKYSVCSCNIVIKSINFATTETADFMHAMNFKNHFNLVLGSTYIKLGMYFSLIIFILLRPLLVIIISFSFTKIIT